MELCLAISTVLLALLIAASGVAAVTRGWLPPWLRRSVRSVRLHGWGQLVMASALCLHVVFRLMLSNQPWEALFGGGLLLTGVILMGAGQHAGGERQANGTS